MPKKVTRKKDILVRKGKNWGLYKNPYSGNYIVKYAGKEYIHSKKSFADDQIKAIIKVNRYTTKRPRKK